MSDEIELPEVELGDGRVVITYGGGALYRVRKPGGEVEAFRPKVEATPDNAIDDIVSNPPAAPASVVVDERPIGTRIPLTGSFHHSEVSSSSGVTLLGVMPPGWAMVDFQAYVDEAFDATRTISVGTAATPARWVNGLAVSTTGFKQATPLQLTPQSAVNGTNIYLKKSASTTLGDILTATALIERKY